MYFKNQHYSNGEYAGKLYDLLNLVFFIENRGDRNKEQWLKELVTMPNFV